MKLNTDAECAAEEALPSDVIVGEETRDPPARPPAHYSLLCSNFMLISIWVRVS